MDIAQRGAAALARARFTFLQKPAAAASLVALADLFFYCHRIGSTLGLFSLALLGLLLLVRPDIVRHRDARLAAAAAALLTLALLYDPSLLGFSLFWIAAALAALLPRAACFGDGWRWAKTLLRHVLVSPIGPFADFRRLKRVGRRRPLGLGRQAPSLILPATGTLVFLLLFAQANPVIADALARLDPTAAFNGFSVLRLLFWLLVLIGLWSLFRPRRFAPASTLEKRREAAPLPGFSLASVTLSLFAFNALFAVQNTLDLAFLWSGGTLPKGMTLAEYAHRGAYPLIATALLAGLFVLVALRPGSGLADSRLVRRLVYLWIAQNVFLVASTILRTLAYIEAYSLTRLRIAALIWMALVAAGLILVCIRIWRQKSGSWLINANLTAALLALAACTVLDLGRIAAGWNVRHARDAGGKGANLDLCYLAALGPSALLPLVELEARTSSPLLKERVGRVRSRTMAALAQDQLDWRGWTYRGARRLAEARSEAQRFRLPAAYAGRHDCTSARPQPLTPQRPR